MKNYLQRGFTAVFAISIAATLGACDTWFGTVDKDPLPGKRISVLTHQRQLIPDPELAKVEILLPAPSPNANWPQPGGFANHAMHHIEVSDNPERVWDIDAGVGSDDEEKFVSSPIVADGKVFVMDAETNVSAFNAENGSQLWTRELTPDEEDDGHISGGIAYEQGRVFATTGFAQVVALDAESGKVIWRKSIGGPMRAAPTVRAGRVFVVTVDNRLFALSAADGSTLWSHRGIAELASILGGGSPAVDGGVVVVPFSSGELVALKVENGRVLWNHSLSAARRTDVVSTLSHIRGRPVIDRGLVFAMSHGGLLVSIDLRSGRRLWDKVIGGLESPWVAGDYLFLLTNDAELVALSRKNGGAHWVTPLPRYEDEEDKEDPIIWTGPILVSDRLIIAGSNSEALAVSPYDGAILGKVEMPDGVTVPPVVSDRSIYFLSDDAELIAYR
ncbi:MAG: PQQ-like beta-propeller repeat protein [Rhodospirillales bacterium]|nr:PQQ-like beta-propeller repeat protein [Rhodospirillales bacterium]